MDEEYLKRFSMSNPPKTPLSRTNKIKEKYDKCIKNGSNDFFLEYLEQRLKKESPILLENLFPYHTTKNIKHYCIWYSENFDVEKFLRDKDLRVVTYFENYIGLKSIKNISHIHVFTF